MSRPHPILSHRLEGEGEPVLLLNGGMMTFAGWQPVAARLRKHYRLLLCDLRGQLLSPGEPHLRLSGHVDDLLELLDQLGIARTHLLGTSFGAEVGLQLAATRPDRVRSLIAVTASDHADRAMQRGVEDLRAAVRDGLQGGDRGRLHDLVVGVVYSQAYSDAHGDELAVRRAQIARLPDSWYEGLEGILSCTESLDLRPVLARIECPTLIVVAGEDRVMSRERSVALAEAISGARLVEHATSGHALVAEDPEWLAERCLEFLGRNVDV